MLVFDTGYNELAYAHYAPSGRAPSEHVRLSDTPAGTLEYRTIFAVGMLLFLSTFALNLVSNWLRNKFREEYA